MIEYSDLALIGAGVFLGILIVAGSYLIYKMATIKINILIHETIEEVLEKPEGQDQKEIKYTFKEKKEKDT